MTTDEGKRESTAAAGWLEGFGWAATVQGVGAGISWYGFDTRFGVVATRAMQPWASTVLVALGVALIAAAYRERARVKRVHR
ncbi:hypothetical protein [Embleya sp. NBC_00896]|uniref:hypothetical protein n=1 Tax=Embleya sp. NBC_00896 TaxID=2975961 RepID=UPI00386D9007|nr:hypothetical protein OG928_01105 [Embleya sp. NBC_00896]